MDEALKARVTALMGHALTLRHADATTYAHAYQQLQDTLYLALTPRIPNAALDAIGASLKQLQDNQKFLDGLDFALRLPEELPAAFVERVSNSGVWSPQEVKNLYSDLRMEWLTNPPKSLPKG